MTSVCTRLYKGFAHSSEQSSLLSDSSTHLQKISAIRRGPRDGWNGMTLKILQYIVIRGVVTRREVESVFGLSKTSALYHLNKLITLGFIMRIGRGPATIYKFVYWRGVHALRQGKGLCKGLGGSGDGANAEVECSTYLIACLRRLCRLRASYGAVKVFLALCLAREYGRALTSGEIASATGYSRRYVQRCLSVLIEHGLVIRLSGRRCRLACYLPCLLPRPIVHTHKYVRRHRYRRRG